MAKSPGIAMMFKMATGIRIRILIHMVGTMATERIPPKGDNMVAKLPRPSNKRMEGRVNIAAKIAR